MNPVTPPDLMDIVFVSGSVLSPDHSRAAYVTKRQNYKKLGTTPAFTFWIAKPAYSANDI